MGTKIIKELIDWDYDFNNEFAQGQRGYTFVIDAWDSPKLALYKFTPVGIKCDHLEKQPPIEMLEVALKSQPHSEDKIYRISPELKTWLEENILNDEKITI